MHFEVEVKLDLTKIELIQALQDFAGDQRHINCDMMILVVLRSDHELNIFCFIFCTETLICLGVKSMIPCRQETLLSSIPPSYSLVSVLEPFKGFLS